MRLLSGRAQSFPYGLDLQNSLVLSTNNLSPSTAADLTDKPTRPGTETRSLLANPVTSRLSFGFPFVRPVNGDNYQLQEEAELFKALVTTMSLPLLFFSLSGWEAKLRGGGQAPVEHPCPGRSYPSQAALLLV